MKVYWTNTALDQLQSIHDYIARHSPYYAKHMVDRITRRSIQISQFPLSGQEVPEYDNDKILAALPGGVSERQFTSHYRGQITPFMNGEKRYWWFSDKEIANHTKTKQMFVLR